MRNSKTRLFSAAMAALMLLPALIGTGCAGSGNETAKDNPFYNYQEVRALNETLEMPFLLGTYEREVKAKGYESYGSIIEHHISHYRSPEAQDVSFTLGTYLLQYGDPDPSTKLFVTGFRIMPEKKEIVTNSDGSKSPVYTTSRSVLGVKVGDNIEDAKKLLERQGYETVYEEEKKMTGVPNSRECTFRNGIVMISFAVERTDDISQIYVWIPYYEPQISSLNEKSSLPADLGLIYSVMENSAFSYAGKNRTSRRYETEDGSVAIMRGFPDLADMAMTAEVSFVSDKYNVLGVHTGMSEAEAVQLLAAAGCTEEQQGVYVYNSVAAVQLTTENGVVTKIAAALRPSTNLSGIETDEG